MKKLYLLISTFFIFNCFTALTQAQDQVKLDVLGNPTLVRFNHTVNYSGQDPKELLISYLQGEQEDNFKMIRTKEDHIGIKHLKFQQYFNGIKVEHGTYTLHIKNNQPLSLTGSYFPVNETSDSKSALTEAEALQKAIEYIDAKVYMWESEENEAWAKEVEPSGTFYPNGELVYIKDYFNEDRLERQNLVLAYKFNIYAQEPLSRDYVYINAETGDVVFSDAIIKLLTKNYNAKNLQVVNSDNTKSNEGSYAATRYSGVQTITSEIEGNRYVLRDYTKGNGIETYNMQNGTNYYAAVDFTDDNNQWTIEEFDNAEKDNAALDAHWGTEKVWDYWMINHGRNSFDGNGAKMKSYVHFNLIQYGYPSNDNAFWNGSVMTYGDGTSMDALTSIDVAAHEIGHAVCSYTANLIYYGESGALNEGFSDIWAACVENFAAPDKNIWEIGEDIGGPIRSLSNPKTYGLPDTYLGTNWYSGGADNGGVHTNNGPFCYWFYLLSEGGSGTNDNGDGYNINAIGIDKAARIAYQTEAYYLESDATYQSAREATILATEEIYGINSNEVNQVKNAWDAVGVYGDISPTGYCESSGNNQTYEWIASVQIGSFLNSSNASGYTNFTDKTIDLVYGEEVNVTLTPGFNGGSYNEDWRIWIDYNGDYDFDDTGEMVFEGSSSSVLNGSFELNECLSNELILRVSMKYGGYPGSCGSFTFGEVEDYTVKITSPNGDITPPTNPTNLTLTNKTSSSVSLSWNASTDEIGVSGYKIYQDDAVVKSVSGTSTTIYGLNEETNYSFYVKAYDYSDNLSGKSNTIYVTTLSGTPTDTEIPSAAQNLSASNIGETSLKLTWDASTDNVGVDHYDVYVNSGYYVQTSTNSILINGLSEGTQYYFFVLAYDASGNASANSTSNWLWVTTLTDQDNQSPSTPQNLGVINIGETDVLLDWNASTDNFAVKQYNIYLDGSYEKTVTGTSTVVSGLNPNTNYSVFVNAEDNAGNTSSNSNQISFLTDGGTTGSGSCEFTLTIYTDSWGYESSWELIDNSTLATIYSGSSFASNSTIEEFLNLQDGKSYTFKIYDSFGDGIWNNPGYTLENSDGDYMIYANGNDFSSSRTHVFTAACASGSTSTIEYPSYCSSKGNNQSYEWIDFVALGAINNVTGTEPGGYGDYSHLTPTLLSPHSYKLYLSAGFSDNRANEYWRVWIDFNIDGDFNDANELIVEGGPFAYDGIISAPFVVPTTINSGYTIMRVAMQYDDYPSSCGTFTYGEVEDYPIELTNSKSAEINTIDLSNTRDINNPVEIKNTLLYPNPVTSSLTITSNIRDSKLQNVSIYNMSGSLVKSQIISDSYTKIDVSNLASGMYTIIITSDQKVINKKFIKQ